MKFIHANQNKKSKIANIPFVPIVEEMSPSPDSSKSLSSSGIECPSNLIGSPNNSNGLNTKIIVLTNGFKSSVDDNLYPSTPLVPEEIPLTPRKAFPCSIPFSFRNLT